MKVKVGQGSCGIATGAKKVADSIDAMIKRDNLDVDLEVTGCVGTCFLEPIVDVYDDEEKLTRYVNVKKSNRYLSTISAMVKYQASM